MFLNFFEILGSALLFGVFVAVYGLIIFAMCRMAHYADKITEEWMKNNEEGKQVDEGD